MSLFALSTWCEPKYLKEFSPTPAGSTSLDICHLGGDAIDHPYPVRICSSTFLPTWTCRSKHAPYAVVVVGIVLSRIMLLTVAMTSMEKANYSNTCDNLVKHGNSLTRRHQRLFVPVCFRVWRFVPPTVRGRALPVSLPRWQFARLRFFRGVCTSLNCRDYEESKNTYRFFLAVAQVRSRLGSDVLNS